MSDARKDARVADPAPAPIDGEEAGELELIYNADHLAAVVKPVALTMAIASWVVANIRERAEEEALREGLSVYLVYDDNSNSGGQGGGGGTAGAGPSGEDIGQAVLNALVIVGVIGAATFMLVFCYYMRWLKLMVGYLMLSSVMLLGYSGGFVVWTAWQVYEVPIDWVTFGLIMWNFAIVGVTAVFYQKGIPRWVTQGYLVCVAVIMSWIITKLPEWSSWALLVALALYDLCAVLTPCGPLRALIALAQERQDPIPGLLYEADVGRGGDDDPDRVRDTLVPQATQNTTARPAATAATQRGADTQPVPTRDNPIGAGKPRGPSAPRTPTPPTPPQHDSPSQGGDDSEDDGDDIYGSQPAAARPSSGTEDEEDEEEDDDIYAAAPPAPPTPPPAGSGDGPDPERVPLRPRLQPTEEEAQAEVEELNAAERSVKLGLGDFVFYSVLVGRAALYDFATVATSYVAILAGLGGTLLLLGVFKKALPALPISIFLGVAMYFLTRVVIVPWISEMALAGVII